MLPACEGLYPGVLHVAVRQVGVVWALGWAFAVSGTASWATRAAWWGVGEMIILLVCKFVLETSRRRRWLQMLRLEGELRALGDSRT